MNKNKFLAILLIASVASISGCSSENQYKNSTDKTISGMSSSSIDFAQGKVLETEGNTITIETFSPPGVNNSDSRPETVEKTISWSKETKFLKVTKASLNELNEGDIVSVHLRPTRGHYEENDESKKEIAVHVRVLDEDTLSKPGFQKRIENIKDRPPVMNNGRGRENHPGFKGDREFKPKMHRPSFMVGEIESIGDKEFTLNLIGQSDETKEINIDEKTVFIVTSFIDADEIEKGDCLVSPIGTNVKTITVASPEDGKCFPRIHGEKMKDMREKGPRAERLPF